MLSGKYRKIIATQETAREGPQVSLSVPPDGLPLGNNFPIFLKA